MNPYSEQFEYVVATVRLLDQTTEPAEDWSAGPAAAWRPLQGVAPGPSDHPPSGFEPSASGIPIMSQNPTTGAGDDLWLSGNPVLSQSAPTTMPGISDAGAYDAIPQVDPAWGAQQQQPQPSRQWLNGYGVQ